MAVASKGALRPVSAGLKGLPRLPTLPRLPSQPHRRVAAQASAFPPELVDTFHMVVNKVEAIENETVSTVLHTPLAVVPVAALLVFFGPKAFEVRGKGRISH